MSLLFAYQEKQVFRTRQDLGEGVAGGHERFCVAGTKVLMLAVCPLEKELDFGQLGRNLQCLLPVSRCSVSTLYQQSTSKTICSL